MDHTKKKKKDKIHFRDPYLVHNHSLLLTPHLPRYDEEKEKRREEKLQLA